nr:hypothetical protein [Synechococcus elongatus]
MINSIRFGEIILIKERSHLRTNRAIDRWKFCTKQPEVALQAVKGIN